MLANQVTLRVLRDHKLGGCLQITFGEGLGGHSLEVLSCCLVFKQIVNLASSGGKRAWIRTFKRDGALRETQQRLVNNDLAASLLLELVDGASFRSNHDRDKSLGNKN